MSTRDRNRGTSLAELLVAVAIFGLMLAVTSFISISAMKAGKKHDIHSDTYRMVMLGLAYLKSEFDGAKLPRPPDNFLLNYFGPGHSDRFWYVPPQLDSGVWLLVDVNGSPTYQYGGFQSYLIAVDTSDPADHWLVKQSTYDWHNPLVKPVLIRRLVDLGNNGFMRVAIPAPAGSYLGLQDVTLHAEQKDPLTYRSSVYELKMRFYFPNQPSIQ